MKKIAVCPGSFDPITKGHLDIARRAVELFGACRILVMNNSQKEYLFSLQDRYELCLAAVEGEEGISVDFSDGMLYSYLQGMKEPVIVKGLRSAEDFLYEKKQAEFNFAHCGVETLYLDAKPELSDLSSTLVREKLRAGEDISGYLPQNVVKLLKNKL